MKNMNELDANHPKTDENIQDLRDQISVQQQQIEELSAKLNWYEEQFRLSQQRRFGTSSEKSDPNQLTLFDEAELEADPKVPEPTVEEITYKRRKTKGKNDKMLEDLPVEVIEYDLPEEDQSCPQCDEHLHRMSKEIRKELKVIPAQVKVVEHVRHVYACRSCEKNDVSTPVITAPMPAPVLPGSLASPSLMAYVMDRK